MPDSTPRQSFLRVSLRELLILVALVALAIPSLKYASEAWLALVAAVTMLAFFVALLVAVMDRGVRQAFLIGFTLIVASYGFIVMNSSQELDQWKGRLPTSRLLRYVHAAVDRSEWVPLNPDLRRGATGELVAVLQRMLNARTVPPPNLEVDGEFGPNTERAVKAFQTQVGQSGTGVVNMETWKALGLSFDTRSGKVSIPAYASPITSGALSMTGGGFLLFGGGSFREIPPRELFMPIGHLWWALVLGCAGGHFARYLYWRRVAEEQRPPQAP